MFCAQLMTYRLSLPSGASPKFARAYRSLCQQLNIQLAPDCPKLEKSFSNSTTGTVVDVQFDTISLTWTLSAKKLDNLLCSISAAISGQLLMLLDMQKLIG